MIPIKKDEQDQRSKESNYIQQHLANERTYLAWVRTSIAMMGVGFLVATLHFNTAMTNEASNTFAVFISLFSLFIGFVTIVIATTSYIRNRRTINNQTFRSPFKMIIASSVVVVFIVILLLVYYILLIS